MSRFTQKTGSGDCELVKGSVIIAIYSAVEDLAANVTESNSSHILTVEHEGHEYGLELEIDVYDVEHEEDTNSHTYKVSVFCNEILNFEELELRDEDLANEIKTEFLFEYIYKE